MPPLVACPKSSASMPAGSLFHTRPTALAVTSLTDAMIARKMQGVALVVSAALIVELCWQVQSRQPPMGQRQQFRKANSPCMRPAVWKTGPMRIGLLDLHRTHAAAALYIKNQPSVVWQRRPSTTLSALSTSPSAPCSSEQRFDNLPAAHCHHALSAGISTAVTC